jgi:hypothetical protein
VVIRRAVVVLTVLAGLGTIGFVVVNRLHSIHLPFVSDTCRVFANGDVVRLAPDQITHAATIAAVGARQQVPERAVTVALATALQESKLRNLVEGDRDSIGLFQQRPSQGWGTPEQLRDPRYASGKFYSHLLGVPGWERMSVTDAAQAVQHSGAPTAYAKWEGDAAAIARAFLGAESGAVTCQLRQQTRIAGSAGLRQSIEELHNDLGGLRVAVKTGDEPSLTVTTRGPSRFTVGWRTAHWFVAKSHEYGISRVAYAGVVWTADSGKWQKGGSTPDDRVDVAAMPAA